MKMFVKLEFNDLDILYSILMSLLKNFIKYVIVHVWNSML